MSTEFALMFNRVMIFLYLATLFICYKFSQKYDYNFLAWVAIITFLPFIGMAVYYILILRRVIVSRKNLE